MRPLAKDVAFSVVGLYGCMYMYVCRPCVNVCVFDCVLGTRMSCAEVAEPIEVPFGR